MKRIFLSQIPVFGKKVAGLFSFKKLRPSENKYFFYIPIFKPPITLFLLLLFICFSCSEKKQMITNFPSKVTTQKEAQFLITSSGDSIPTGIPILTPGKQLNLKDVPIPKATPNKTKPQLMPIHKNMATAGMAKVLKMPKELSSATMGQNGFELPSIVPAIGIEQPVVYPKPVPALSPQMKDNATADIQYLDIAQNMNASAVWTMLQDSQGNLWFGTFGGGVSRYDGSSFTHFTEKEGLSSNHIFSILEDSRGHLWFGTRGGGVSRYDGKTFTNFTTEGGLVYNSVLAIIEDRDGNLWFGTGGGVSRYDGKTFTNYTTKQGLVYDIVISVFEDSHRNIWIGTGNGTGLHKFDGKTFTHYNLGEGKGQNDIHAIMEDSQDNLWFGTWGGGVTRYDGKQFTQFTKEQGLISNHVVSILEDKEGIIWFGNLTAGVTRFDGVTFRNYTLEEGLSSTNVKCIIEDFDGNIWASTLVAGVNRIKKNGFTHFTEKDDLGTSKVQAITKDRQGNLWFGNGAAGFSRYDGKNIVHYTSEESIINIGILGLQEDSQGNLWLGAGGGVTRFDGTSLLDYTQEEGLYVGDIRTILEDSQGRLWFGAQTGGIILFDKNSYTQFDDASGFTSNDVFASMEDSQGNIWFGTLGGGVSRFDGMHFTHYTTNEGLSHNFVRSILEDRQGNLWFGTEAGLNRYDGTHFTHYTTKDGLIHNNISSLLLDKEDNIWMTTQGGISLLKPLPNEDKQAKKQAYQFFNFGQLDGLNKAHPSQGTFVIDELDQIWFGCNSELIMLDLNQFKTPNQAPTKVQLTDIDINQESVDYRRLANSSDEIKFSNGAILKKTFDSVATFLNYPINLTLPYDLNHLTFYFSAIDWAAPHKIQYSFWMEGVDKNWSLPQTVSKVDYRNLSYGEFTLKVKAIGAAQVWSAPFSYTFTISPPWWHSWWAYVLYLIAGLSLLWGLGTYELNRRLAQSEALRLQELDTVKTTLYTNITHEFRTPLTVILGLANHLKTQVFESGKEGLLMIERNGKQLLQLVNQLLDLQKLEAQSMPVNKVQGDLVAYLKYLMESFHTFAASKNIRLHFLTDLEDLTMDYDPEKIQHIVSNLLSNALKFTDTDGDVYMRLSVEKTVTKDKLPTTAILNIKDTGVGISADKLNRIFDRFYQIEDSSIRKAEGTGIGLALTKALVDLLEGTIVVTSQLGKGTTFIVRLPITRQAPLMQEHLATDWGILPTITSPDDAIQSVNTLEDKPTLLIIEDNADVVQYLKICLENKYQLYLAYDGEAGIEKAVTHIPDIIISDVMMPRKDGLEVCNTLKTDVRTSHIPIILLTAKVDMAARLQGLQQGADVYLAKPFEPKELLVRLETLLQQRTRLQKHYLSLYGVSTTATISPPDLQAVLQKEHVFVTKAKAIIETNLANPQFGVELLSREMALSTSQLYRKLKAQTGKSAQDLIHSIRLQNAQKLLKETTLSIAEIAYAVGYSEPDYFSKVFKKEFGRRPTEFRNLAAPSSND